MNRFPRAGVSLAGIGLFALLAASVAAHGALTRFDDPLAVRLHDHARSSPVILECFRILTVLGTYRGMVIYFLLIAAVQRFAGRRKTTPAWLLAASGGLLQIPLKHLVPRLRPQFPDPLAVESSLSFPSGHAMATLIGYGVLTCVVWRATPKRSVRIGATAAASAVVLAVGFSRLYLGVHYLSDVLGGYAAGLAWLAACVTIIDGRLAPKNSLPRPHP